MLTGSPHPTQDQNVPPARFSFKPFGPPPRFTFYPITHDRYLPEIAFDDLLVKVPIEGYSRQHDKTTPQGAITLRLEGCILLHPDHPDFERRNSDEPHDSEPDFHFLYAQVPVQSDAGYVEWMNLHEDEIGANGTFDDLPARVLEACLEAAPDGWLEAQREAYERTL